MTPEGDGITRGEVKAELSEVWHDVKETSKKVEKMDGVLDGVKESVEKVSGHIDKMSDQQTQMQVVLARLDEREINRKSFSARVLALFTIASTIIGALVGGFFSSKGN